jgi:hypothetical protein
MIGNKGHTDSLTPQSTSGIQFPLLKMAIFKKPSPSSFLVCAENICMASKEIDWGKPVNDFLALRNWRLLIAPL